MKSQTEEDLWEIGRRGREIANTEAGYCKLRAAGTSVDCWCIKGAQNGYNVECPPPRRDPEPPPELPPFHLPELTETPWFPRRA